MKKTLWICMLLGVGSTAPGLLRADNVYSVTVDTTPLAAASGYMGFDLLGGSPLQGNVARISGFSSTSSLETSSTSGDVTGSLTPGPLSLKADQFFNEWLEGVTFASGLTTFTLDLTTSFIQSSAPDSFSFFLLQSTFIPYATSDPTGADSLLSIDLIGEATSPEVFTSAFATVTVSPVVSSVPEPDSVVSAGLALLAVGAYRWRRPRFHS